MSNDVENKVVSMTFDNSKFSKRMEETLQGLKKLQESLKLTEGAKGMKNVAADMNKIDVAKPVGMLAKLQAAMGRIGASRDKVDLNKAVALDATKTVGGLGSIRTAMSNVGGARGNLDMAPIGVSVDGISAKFIAMSGVAIAAITGIVSQAAAAGSRIAKSFTIDPISSGFGEYELKMGSIQTIMAGTGASLDEVNERLNALNIYSDKTIYSFSDMTSSIGQFTNAGVSLKDSVAAIQGVSNAAALSGSNAEKAKGAMYAFGQALGTGSLKLQDWNQIENSGIGTVGFKNQLLEAAVAMGTLTKKGDEYVTSSGQMTSATKGWRDSLQDGWITNEVLTSTLGKYSDETTELGKKAAAAATDVKTFSQMMDTLKESAGSGWATTFETVFGNFEEGKGLWTGINNAIGGVISNSAKARNEMLQGWKVFGGRDTLFEGLKNVGTALLGVINPIRLAFRQLFPKQTASGLIELTNKFRDFTAKLTLSGGTMTKLYRIFRGFFSVIKMGVNIVGGIIKVFGKLLGGIASVFGAIGGGGDKIGILSFLANIADFFTFITGGPLSGGLAELGIGKFFKTLGDGAAKIGGYLGTAAKAVAGFFGGILAFAGGKVMVAIRTIPGIFASIAKVVVPVLKTIGKTIQDLVGKIPALLNKAKDALSGFFGTAMNATSGIRSTLSGAGGSILAFFKKIPTMLLTAKFALMGFYVAAMIATTGVREKIGEFAKAIVGFFQGVVNSAKGVGSNIGGALSNIASFFGGLIGGIKDGSTSLLNALGAIGSAIGNFFSNLFGGSKGSSSVTDSEDRIGGAVGGLQKMTDATDKTTAAAERGMSVWDNFTSNIRRVGDWVVGVASGITGAIGSLFGGMGDSFHELFGGIGDAIASTNFDKVVNVAALWKILSIFKDLSGGVSSFFKGIEGVNDVISEFGDTLKAFQLKLKAEAIRAIAVAVAILAASAIALSFVDGDKLMAAMAGMSIGMASLVASIAAVDQTGMSKSQLIGLGLGLLFMSGAMILLSIAVASFSSMRWQEIALGMGSVAVGLGLMVGAIKLMGDQNENIAKAGVAILLMSGAMWLMANAVEAMSKLEYHQIFRGLTGIAGSMIILVFAMRAMAKDDMAKTGLGMLVLAYGLKTMAKAVEIFANMDPEAMARGLSALAVSLLVVVAALNYMPGGKAMIGKATGMLILSIALIAIAGAVKLLGGEELGNLAQGLIALGIALGAIVLAANLMSGSAAGAASMLVMAIALKILTDVIKGLGEMRWQEIALGIGAIVVALLLIGGVTAILGLAAPLIASFGLAMLVVGVGMLAFGLGVSLVAKAISELVDVGAKGIPLFINLIKSIMKSMPEFISILAQGIVKGIGIFLDSLPPLIAKLGKVFEAILKMISDLLPAVFEVISQLVKGIIKVFDDNIPGMVNAGFDLLMALLRGLDEHMDEIVTRAVSIVTKLINGIADNADKLTEAAVNLITSFLEAIGGRSEEILAAGVKLLTDFLAALGDSAETIATAVGTLITDLIGALSDLEEDIRGAGVSAVTKFLSGITDDIILITDAATKMVTTFIGQIGLMATEIAQAGTNAIVAFLNGIASNVTEICGAAKNVISAFIGCLSEVFHLIVDAGVAALRSFTGGIGKVVSEVATKGGEAVGQFLAGLGKRAVDIGKQGVAAVRSFRDGIGDTFGEILGKGVGLARALIDGIVKGITELGKRAVKEVEGLAGSLLDAGKNILGINSPSKEFAKIGKGIIEGLVVGITDDKDATDSVTNLGKGMMKAYNNAVSDLAGIGDIAPTITPVLDLTNVKMGARSIDGMLGGSSITPGVSMENARMISAASTPPNDEAVAAASGGGDVNFIQNNYSPKALSTADIYRQSKGLIARKKEELGIAS